MNTLRERFDAIKRGRVVGKDQPKRLAAIEITNPDGRCHYCTMPLTGGPSTTLEHVLANGAEIRKTMNTRQEIAAILNGEDRNVVFACANCNAEKATMSYDEFINGEYLKWVRPMMEKAFGKV